MEAYGLLAVLATMMIGWYGIQVGDGMDEGMVMRKLDGDHDSKRCQWN